MQSPSEMLSKKVVLTGVSGHLGYHVVNELLDRGYEVHCLIRRENINVVKSRQKGANIYQCDLFNKNTYFHVLKDALCAFHIAAENTTSKAFPERVIKNTLLLTKSFTEACLEAGVQTIIYTSSVVVLGRSRKKSILLNENDRTSFIESPYVQGKFEADKYIEKLIEEKNADIRRLYPAWIVGENDPKMTPPHKIITNYVEKGQIFFFKGGISICDVKEVAKAHINAFEKGKPSDSFVLGGNNITFKHFYNTLSLLTGHKKPFIYLPKWAIVAGAYFSTWIFRMLRMEPVIEPAYAKSVFGNYSWYNSSKAKLILDYHILSEQEILKNAIFEARKRLNGSMQLGFRKNIFPEKATDDGLLLLTGAPGWLGNRMIDIFINGDKKGNYYTNRKIRILVEPKYKEMLNLPSNFELFYGDLGNNDALLEATKGVKTVFHLAGAIYPKKIKTLYKVNTEGTKNLVDACIENKVRRIIYMSTDSVCGRGIKNKRIFDETSVATPYKHYGRSKYLAEKYIFQKTQEGQIDGTVMRGFWFFGPFAPQRQLNFFKMFSLPRQIVFGNGKNFRSISHVDNIVHAFLEAENNKQTFGKWYWIGGDKTDLTVDQMFKMVCNNLNIQYKPLYIPAFLCRFFSTIDHILSKFGYLNSSIHAAGKFYYDISGSSNAAKRDFNYSPVVNEEEAIVELCEMLNN